MQTCCPNCQTSFRVTPEQLKVRAGKVRCGQCQTVFNALDSLLEGAAVSAPSVSSMVSALPVSQTSAITEVDLPLADDLPVVPLSNAAVQALGKAAGLILPRETTEIPGYSKWAEGIMSYSTAPALERTARWPFVLVALLLVLVLAGQLVFHFRSEVVVAAPGLRPVLEAASKALGFQIPLPRRAELLSIETSDLQTDPLRSNLLTLQATLRNQAGYGQAYPLLELSLTDTQDNAIVRRVFRASDYLPPTMLPEQAFPAHSDITVRLWIETKDITAAGYRLYVFYP